MSFQFGKCEFDGPPPNLGQAQEITSLLSEYGPDGGETFIEGSAMIAYRALHTTTDSLSEKQPCLTRSASILTWDGRLDERESLARELQLNINEPDVNLVASAFEKWGRDCLQKLLGDWALSLYDPETRSVLLAKDFAGVRPLFYYSNDRISLWSSLLDPILRIIGPGSLKIDESYLAGWLGSFPATHLTPYREIHAVPPGCFVELNRNGSRIHRYWSFDPQKVVRYPNDREYEQHFLHLFRQSVARRVRSHKPVLAELSGGMDSSSIVCVADTLLAEGIAETPRIDTISYCNDSEPNWQEEAYFSEVEHKRGGAGTHIAVDVQKVLDPFDPSVFVSSPGVRSSLTAATRLLRDCTISQGNRVLLSGIGGDECLGGVPVPEIELADLLASGYFARFARQLVAWSLCRREPLLYLAARTLRVFLPASIFATHRDFGTASWLVPAFSKRHRHALRSYPKRIRFFGSSPSFQANLLTFETVRRQIASAIPSSAPPLERRYPYLDRDLLEFLFAIPREQVLRPHHRRSLMRRALTGIVPDAILNRRRKAFIARGPLVGFSNQWEDISRMTRDMASASRGMVNQAAFLVATTDVRAGREVPYIPLVRMLMLEQWLRQFEHATYIHDRLTTPAQRELERNLPLPSAATQVRS